MSQATTKINTAVTAGKLTQDKATQMEVKLQDRIKKLVERKGFGKHHAQQSSQATTAAPASTTSTSN